MPPSKDCYALGLISWGGKMVTAEVFGEKSLDYLELSLSSSGLVEVELFPGASMESMVIFIKVVVPVCGCIAGEPNSVCILARLAAAFRRLLQSDPCLK